MTGLWSQIPGAGKRLPLTGRQGLRRGRALTRGISSSQKPTQPGWSQGPIALGVQGSSLLFSTASGPPEVGCGLPWAPVPPTTPKAALFLALLGM